MSFFDSPILITGVPRSGTSLTAGCLNQCGAWVGRTVGANQDNPKGFFENMQIREKVVKGYLQSYGYDKMGQDLPLPPIQSSISPQDNNHAPLIRKQVEEILKSEGYRGEQWLFKDAKLALIWSAWAAAFPNSKWVLVRRNKNDIAESCKKTGFMRAFNTKAEWLLWVAEYEERFDALKRNCRFYELWFEDLVEGKLDYLEEMVRNIGLTWNEEKVREFIIRR